MYGDPRPGRPSPAAVQAAAVLRAHVRRVAEVGRLRVSEEHAADVVHAAGCGTVFTLLAVPATRRDLAVSHVTRDAVIAAITTDAVPLASPGPVGAAVALRAVLDDTSALTTGERALLGEWLTRIASGTPTTRSGDGP
jgi:hypothetical protein